jgi:hypothetical protein
MFDRQFDIRVSEGVRRLLVALVVIGAATLVGACVLAPQRGWANLLLVSYGLVGVGLGATFFLALNHLSAAGWATALRRVPESMCSGLLLGEAGIALVLLVGAPYVYPWVKPDAQLAHALTGFKGFWLDRPFFLLRAVVYLGVWGLLAWAMVRASRAQDAGGELKYTQRNVRLGAVFMVGFALTFWPAAFDWIMSLDPHWYSTIFGIYNFAGAFQSALAIIILLSLALRRMGPFRSILTEDHLHDLGKLLFGFSTFWMYIWFSQYMLIWYVNWPEETAYFIRRQEGAWAPLLVANLFLNWVVPFFALLSRRAKRSPTTMVRVAVVVLVGRWLDLYLMIFPDAVSGQPSFGVWELGIMAGAVAAFVLLFFRVLRGAAPVPMKDPYVLESLYYHQ